MVLSRSFSFCLMFSVMQPLNRSLEWSGTGVDNGDGVVMSLYGRPLPPKIQEFQVIQTKQSFFLLTLSRQHCQLANDTSKIRTVRPFWNLIILILCSSIICVLE